MPTTKTAPTPYSPDLAKLRYVERHLSVTLALALSMDAATRRRLDGLLEELASFLQTRGR